MTPQQQSFLKAFIPAVLEWEATQTLPFRRTLSIITVAQAALETGWGAKSVLSLPLYNNWGGIKWHIQGWPAYVAPSREVINGKDTFDPQKFQTYPTIADFIQDHATVLLRWRCVRDGLALGVQAGCEALGPWDDADRKAMKEGRMGEVKTSNYSSDPAYSKTLMQIITGLGLTDSARLEGM